MRRRGLVEKQIAGRRLMRENWPVADMAAGFRLSDRKRAIGSDRFRAKRGPDPSAGNFHARGNPQHSDDQRC